MSRRTQRYKLSCTPEEWSNILEAAGLALMRPNRREHAKLRRALKVAVAHFDQGNRLRRPSAKLAKQFAKIEKAAASILKALGDPFTADDLDRSLRFGNWRVRAGIETFATFDAAPIEEQSPAVRELYAVFDECQAAAEKALKSFDRYRGSGSGWQMLDRAVWDIRALRVWACRARRLHESEAHTITEMRREKADGYLNAPASLTARDPRDWAMETLYADLAVIWRDILQQKVGTSVVEGEAGGPMVRFMAACLSSVLEVPPTDEAIRSAIKRIVKRSPNLKEASRPYVEPYRHWRIAGLLPDSVLGEDPDNPEDDEL